MIRIINSRVFGDTLMYIEGACVDADLIELPTTGIVTGSKMTCADSGDVYMFAEGDSPAWNKIQTGPTAAAGS